MRVSLLILLLPFCFSACMRSELPVPKQDRGDVITASVNMESDYRYQIYYSLSENREVGRNLRTAWDLGFETGAGGYRVVLNGAKAMFAYPVAGENLAAIGRNDTADFSERLLWDASSGNLDSTVMSDWRKGGGIYIVDRGSDNLGRPLGVYKIRLRSVDDVSYQIEYGPLDSKAPRQLRIVKDSSYNLAFLHLDSAATSIIEPIRTSWDLVFTQYTHTFYEPAYQSYQVTGCMLNRYRTLASKMDTGKAFAAITSADFRPEQLRPALNEIGYDWKYFTGSAYITDPKKAYFVADQLGYRYKLHFVDFINAAGVKGNPKWEYQAL